MEIEFLVASKSMERVIMPMIPNLNKLGIKSSIRTVDSSQYIKRLEDFDFDMTVHVFGQSNSPETSRWIIGIRLAQMLRAGRM